MPVKAALKLALLADDQLIAQSDDAALWVRILGEILAAQAAARERQQAEAEAAQQQQQQQPPEGEP